MLGVFIQKGILLGIPKNHYICKLKAIRTLSKMVRAQQKAPKPSQQCGGFLFLFHFQYFIKSYSTRISQVSGLFG